MHTMQFSWQKCTGMGRASGDISVWVWDDSSPEAIFCSVGDVTGPGMVAAVPRSRGRPWEIVPSYHCSWYREIDWGLSACLFACLSHEESARLNIQLTSVRLHTLCNWWFFFLNENFGKVLRCSPYLISQVCVGDVCCTRLPDSHQYRRVMVEEVKRQASHVHDQVCLCHVTEWWLCSCHTWTVFLRM